jgi:SHS family lactate transporter-like MFS transporter
MLMLDIALFSFFELASAFAPNLAVLFVLRLLFGFAMGGRVGIGFVVDDGDHSREVARLRLRSAAGRLCLRQPARRAAVLAAVRSHRLARHVHRRFLPSLLVFYIRSTVPESPVWEHTQRTKTAQERHPLTAMKATWGRAAFMIVLMTLFNCFSHGTQDLYPLFLQVEKGFGTDLTGKLATIGPIGAICGGLFSARCPSASAASARSSSRRCCRCRS